MDPPIFLVERDDGSTWVFASVEEAALLPEAIDAMNGEYVAYDAQGRLLAVSLVRNHVVIESVDSEPEHKVELEDVIRRFLQTRNDPLGVDLTCDLPSLVEACRKFVNVYPKTILGLLTESLRHLFGRIGSSPSE